MAELTPNAEGYTLSGRLDNQSSNHVYNRLPSSNNSAVALDLSNLERIDSAGLALLVLWSNRQHQAGGALALRNIPMQAKQMIDILGLNEILPT